MIKVCIVEDKGAVRQSMATLIERGMSFSCVGAYGDCEAALKNLLHDRPDVVLLDIGLPGISGIEGVEHIKAILPGAEILMLTIRDDHDAVFESLRRGASGYLLKNVGTEELLDAIRDVHAGGSPMSMQIARMVTSSFRRKPPPEPLTSREEEVLERLRLGHSYQDIANSLFVSKSTIKFHIKNIYRKLHVANRVEAATKT